MMLNASKFQIQNKLLPQALAQELAERHATSDLSDIHLLVKVVTKFYWPSSNLIVIHPLLLVIRGSLQWCAWVRRELDKELKKEVVCSQSCSSAGKQISDTSTILHVNVFFCFNRYQGRCKGSVSEKGKMKSPFRLNWFYWSLFYFREDLNWKKTFSFGHCPNYLNPPPMTPIRATWSSFFGSRNSRFESQFRT